MFSIMTWRINDQKVVKIADFGLARDIYERDYYSVKDKNRPMPYKWMAPECFENYKFDTQSDVVRVFYYIAILLEGILVENVLSIQALKWFFKYTQITLGILIE